MRRKCLFILVLLPFKLWAQENHVVKTDSSEIETKYFESLNSIRVFNRLYRQRKEYYTGYYLDNKKTEEQGIFLNGNCVGVWKQFWPNGKLKREINFDKGTFEYFDKKAYPYYNYQNKIKLKGDSILKKIFSDDFLKKYIVWDIGHSYVYNGNLGSTWLENTDMDPKRFLLRYMIKLDNKTYPEIIEFEIDAKGKFLDVESIKGLEKLPANTSKTFSLTVAKATVLAKQKAIDGKYKNEISGFLTWEKQASKTIYNGHYRIYVPMLTNSIKDIRPNGRSMVVDKFDVYVFDPWSAIYIGVKKMQAVRGWEENSGSSSGLVPDN